MSDEQVPNLSETEITDLWRFRAEHKDAEDFHQARRRAADHEVLQRAASTDAQVLATEAGDIEITYPTQYAYDTFVVEGELRPLLRRDGLLDEWQKYAKRVYKIDKRYLNRLAKRGAEYKQVIERMTLATTGSPTIKGPELAALGEYVEA